MSEFKTDLPDAAEWGHVSPRISPDKIIVALRHEIQRSLQDFLALPEGPEPCHDKPGYCRVSVTIPIDETLFDQLMNGCTGYRAHYFVSIRSGEEFNRRLVDNIAPIIVEAERFYKDKFNRDLCRRSLSGSFSKVWFPKELTDPSAQDNLRGLKEELRVPRWTAYWRNCQKPWKGLLAPIPESKAILLNGTFVNNLGEEYEQKPGRSQQVFESGWT